MKFFHEAFSFSKCNQIRIFLWIWSHLLKISLMEKFIFCAVLFQDCSYPSTLNLQWSSRSRPFSRTFWLHLKRLGGQLLNKYANKLYVMWLFPRELCEIFQSVFFIKNHLLLQVFSKFEQIDSVLFPLKSS